jgi:hypothetical protein
MAFLTLDTLNVSLNQLDLRLPFFKTPPRSLLVSFNSRLISNGAQSASSPAADMAKIAPGSIFIYSLFPDLATKSHKMQPTAGKRSNRCLF